MMSDSIKKITLEKIKGDRWAASANDEISPIIVAEKPEEAVTLLLSDYADRERMPHVSELIRRQDVIRLLGILRVISKIEGDRYFTDEGYETVMDEIRKIPTRLKLEEHEYGTL